MKFKNLKNTNMIAIDVDFLKAQFPRFKYSFNRVGNLNIYKDDETFWTIGYSKTYGGFWIRKTLLTKCSSQSYPESMRPYFVKESWIQRSQFPLNYDRKTGCYMFNEIDEALEYFVKYIKKHHS